MSIGIRVRVRRGGELGRGQAATFWVVATNHPKAAVRAVKVNVPDDYIVEAYGEVSEGAVKMKGLAPGQAVRQ